MHFTGTSATLSLALLLLSGGYESVSARPNIVVVQPDDFPMLEEWRPPNHSPGDAAEIVAVSASKLPNIEKLRTEGVQMMQAYTASPKCGTSRYSTLTGRYPSRSAFGRGGNLDQSISEVDIPFTKLQDVSDVSDGKDCSERNLASLLQQNGYRTGMVGKWHLLDLLGTSYNYNLVQDSVRGCGFDFAESIYSENLVGDWNDGTFSHNMEYMTSEAIDFIKNEEDKDEPFFLYFNPTAPHSSGNVLSALTDFSCRKTPGGEREFDPYSVDVEGRQVAVVSEEGCRGYRQTIIDRAEGATDNVSLGTIWVDDAIGALIQTLKDTNQYANTLFLFQMDHGQEGKSTLWENGIRLAQFVKLPHQHQRMRFRGMVSTIDIAPTVLDYAGVDEYASGVYRMDGISWRQAVEANIDGEAEWNSNRCLFFEMNQDRAVRCGCYKYMTLVDRSVTSNRGRRRGYATGSDLVFDLCDGVAGYDDDQQGENPESNNILDTVSDDVASNLIANLDCHIERTLPSRPPVHKMCGPDTLSLIEVPPDPLEQEEPEEPEPEEPETKCRRRRSRCRPHSRRGCQCCDGLVCRRGRYGGGKFKCRPPL